MTRDDAKRIMDNLEVISHFANGGDIEWCMHDHTGKFLKWYGQRNTVLLSCLGRYRIVKPHLALKNGNFVQAPKKPPCTQSH